MIPQNSALKFFGALCVAAGLVLALAWLGPLMPEPEPTPTVIHKIPAKPQRIGKWRNEEDNLIVSIWSYNNSYDLVVRGIGVRYENSLVKRGTRYYLPNGDDYFEISLDCLHAYDSVGLIWTAC